MNAEELIKSGKLELYVAGALCGKEAREVAAMVKEDPSLQKEVKEIEFALLSLSDAGNAQPGAELKNKVMAAVRQSSTTGNNEDSRVMVEGPKVIKMSTVNVWLAAASVALLLALTFTFYKLNRKIDEQQSDIAELNGKYNAQLTANAKYTDELALINHSNTKKVLLSGVALSPNSKAVVYWNNLNGRVIINPANLPTPPNGKQYQLWALKDGKPVDAGVFDITNDSIKLQELKNIADAQAFAITLEQKGGVPAPTLSAMYAMGNI